MSEELAIGAIGAISAHIDADNILDVTAQDLLTFTNPRGEGVFVYVTLTRFEGVKRHALWLVVKDQAFPFNSLAKLVTPSLPWPDEAESGLRDEMGLSSYSAEEVVELVFGHSRS